MTCPVCRSLEIEQQPQGGLHAYSTVFTCGAELITIVKTGEEVMNKPCKYKEPAPKCMSEDEAVRAIFLAITAIEDVLRYNDIQLLDEDYGNAKHYLSGLLDKYVNKGE